MKPEQENNTEMNIEPLNRLQEAETQVKTKSRMLRKKSLLFFTSSMVLIVILILAAIAWYTRVANTYAVTFDVAEYDLAVNENVDEEYLLNIYDYSNVTKQKMAPGTVGWIPLKLSAYRSDVDVTYSVSVQSLMPEEIRKHMRFFYLKDTNNEIVYGNPISPDSIPQGYQKVYLDHLDRTAAGFDVIQDTITKRSDPKTLCIYWEWYYDAAAARAAGAFAAGTGMTLSAEEEARWDDLDTDIGRYPDKYKDALTVYIYTSGVEAIPDLEQKTQGSGGTP